MNLNRQSLLRLSTQYRQRQLSQIYEEFRDFTMVSPETYVDNLRLAQRTRDIEGCVIECGVWRGGMIAGIARVLGAGRDYYLFDSFEGLPPAREIDGAAALKWQRDTTGRNYHDNCSAGPQFAEIAMQRASAVSFHLIKGWFDKTLPGFRPRQSIALLRLDADWYDSTMVCLDALFDHMAPGGLIILDDYYTWDGCSRALHDFLSRRSATERIRNLGEICYLQKL
jgi:O-methyltransferase